MNGIRHPQALRITAIYLVFGVLWLVLTEILLVDLIRNADSAMYQVKNRDQNAFHFSTQSVS